MNPPADLSPATDKKLVALVFARGLVSRETLDKVVREPRRGSLARALCERGLLSRELARALLHEIRESRETQGLPPKEQKTTDSAIARLGVLVPGWRLGSYRIEAELGRGGQGAVYRAFDERLQREVALKTLIQGDQEARERFVREARAAARIRHPGVVAVLGAELIGGVPVIALELVPGISLAKKIKEKGPLAPHEAATIVRDVALAVAAAHEEGILHRDLKPANVLLDGSGRPRLTDFGLASDVEATGITETGVAMGTPAFMSPEQAQAQAATPTTDVYGLGAILYDCLAGRPPFEGSGGLAILKKVIEEEPERPSRLRTSQGLAAVPLDLETILVKALEKKPERRYASAEALAKDLDRFARGEAVSARAPGPLERVVRRLKKRPLVSLSLGMLFATLAGAPFALSRARSSERARAEEERLARIARARSEAEDALAAFTRAVATRGYTLEHALSPIVLMTLQQGENASISADRYRVLAPDDPHALALSIDAKRGLAELALRMDLLDLADFIFREADALAAKDALDLHRAFQDALALIRRRLGRLNDFGRARALMASKDPGEHARAVVLLSELLAVDPTSNFLREMRAEARFNAGDLDGAEAELRELLEAEPRNVDARLDLGTMLLHARGDFEGARESADRAVRLLPDYGRAYFLRARARLKLGDREGARSDEEKCIEYPGGVDLQLLAALHGELHGK